MISKGKNALIIFKNCLNKFFEVMLGGLLKDSIKTVRQRDALCSSEGVVSYAAFFCHVTQLGKISHATLHQRTKYLEKYMSVKTPKHRFLMLLIVWG